MKSVENSTGTVKAGKDEGREWVERRVRKGERAKGEIQTGRRMAERWYKTTM